MDILKEADLKQLLEVSGETCVSLYMPTHRAGQDQQQDPIRLKKLLADAEEKLVKSGLRRNEAMDFLLPAGELLQDHGFWQHRRDGLAVFLSPEFSRSYRLPARFKKLVVTGGNFHIKPLLPLLTEEGSFYLLTLSRNQVRLFRGTKDTFSEVEVKGLAADMQEALMMDEPERSVNFHTGTRSPGGTGERPAMFYGQNPQDQEKNDMLRYFRLVDRAVTSLIPEKTTPIVLAGAEFLLPIYHEASTYNGLLDEGISGNAEEADLKQLHTRAWEIVQPIFRRELEEALQTFQQYEGQHNGLATGDLKEAVKAAEVGRVETLFVPLGVEKWGRYDGENNRVLVDKGPAAGNEELFDLAARRTLLTSGQVYALPPEQIPGKGELAAILRYPL